MGELDRHRWSDPIHAHHCACGKCLPMTRTERVIRAVALTAALAALLYALVSIARP